MIVSDVMSTDVVTVTQKTPLRDAAVLMLEAGVSGLPVVDDQRLVGIITDSDFVHREAANEPSTRHRLLGVLFGHREGRTNTASVVGDVMSTELVTVDASMTVTRAARFMVDNGVKRLPVVDDGGLLVGVISRTDVMRVFVRPDEDVAAEISELMSRRMLPVAPGEVRVTVVDGVVMLQGKVDARVDAEVLTHIASRTDGVFRVDDQLEWDVDSDIPGERFSGYPREGKED